jgi:hypothetical protein
MTNLDSLIAIGSFALGLLTALGGALVAYLKAKSTRELKAYAAERDFQHLKRSYEALALAVAELGKEQDNNFEQLHLNQIEIKAILLGRYKEN